MKETIPQRKTYRVWISQVNEAYVDVVAENKSEAISKGFRKWRREKANHYVSHIEIINDRQL